MNNNIHISSRPLSTSTVETLVSDPSCGGISLFVGNVRNLTKEKTVISLTFEAYEPMAIKEMQIIVDTIKEKWNVRHVAIHHRIGTLTIGETAVIIGVSGPHRKDAIAACSYAIDTLKQTVPIWKKEIFEDGEVWVAAHP